MLQRWKLALKLNKTQMHMLHIYIRSAPSRRSAVWPTSSRRRARWMARGPRPRSTAVSVRCMLCCMQVIIRCTHTPIFTHIHTRRLVLRRLDSLRRMPQRAIRRLPRRLRRPLQRGGHRADRPRQGPALRAALPPAPHRELLARFPQSV